MFCAGMETCLSFNTDLFSQLDQKISDGRRVVEGVGGGGVYCAGVETCCFLILISAPNWIKSSAICPCPVLHTTGRPVSLSLFLST